MLGVLIDLIVGVLEIQAIGMMETSECLAISRSCRLHLRDGQTLVATNDNENGGHRMTDSVWRYSRLSSLPAQAIDKIFPLAGVTVRLSVEWVLRIAYLVTIFFNMTCCASVKLMVFGTTRRTALFRICRTHRPSALFMTSLSFLEAPVSPGVRFSVAPPPSMAS